MRSRQLEHTSTGTRSRWSNPLVPAPRTDESRPLARRTLALVVFITVLMIDVATKAWATAALADPVRISDWLYLMLHRNAGMFLGAVPVSAGYWICICAAAGWFGWRTWRSTSTPLAVCLAVVLAGVVGNAIGQIQGSVVDFIGFGPITGNTWLVGNVADLAMVLGALVLAFVLVSKRASRYRHGRAPGR